METLARTHLVVRVVEDEDHTAHLWADVDHGYQERELVAEEIENLDAGIWTAYGVTASRVCDCCGNEVESYVTALWGCVVETSGLAGTYQTPGEISDPYIREVAAEVLAEAESRVVSGTD